MSWILTFLGILLWVGSSFLKHIDLGTIRRIKAGGVVLILAGLVLSSLIVINPGMVGVKSLFGNVSPDVLNSGLRFVNPLVKVHKFDIRTQNYTMSGTLDEGNKIGDDAIRVLTADGLEVVVDLSVLYRPIATSCPKILSTIGVDYENILIRPLTRTRIRDNAVYYDAVSLYSTNRDEFQNKIFKTIEKDLVDRGFLLEQLLVRNITLPESVKKTIESKINAEQEAQKMQFVLQKEKQEAERKRVEAQGISDYQRIITSTLTDKQLQYEMIKAYKELALSQNSKVIVLGDGKQPVILDSK